MNLRAPATTTQDASRGTLFCDLPPEMLMSIISHVDNEADLLNLSLVSKQINKLVQSALYASYLNFNMCHSRSITPFLRNILKNESLARACKKVDLANWMNTSALWEPNNADDLKELSHEDFYLFANAAEKTKVIQARDSTRRLRPFYTQPEDDDPWDLEPKIETDEDYLRALLTGVEEPQVILMLSCLPRIEELCLRGVDDIEEPIFWSRMASIAGPGLNTLKKLTLSSAPDGSCIGFRGLEYVLGLPSLREFRALSLVAEENRLEPQDGFELQEKSISLDHIVFEDASFGERGISTLMAACKHLESFTYTVCSDRYEGNARPGMHFTLPQLKQSLLPHKNSLKHLAIDMNKWPYAHDYEIMGSLDQFTALETLAIDYGSFRWHPQDPFMPMHGDPVDVAVSNVHEANISPPLPTTLPSSLRELTVLYAPPIVVESLMALQDTPVDRLPFLNRIYIHHTTCMFQNYPLRYAVRAFLISVGIHFFTSHKYPMKTLHDELIENGDFFRTRWDGDKKQYISAPARWVPIDLDEEHDLCTYHSQLEHEESLFMPQSPGSDASDQDDFLGAILDIHGIGPYMSGFWGDDDESEDEYGFSEDFDDEEELDEEFDDDIIDDGGSLDSDPTL
ncbi:hypothetical protein IWX90DRAFT_483199 [Phyllosticta citrichinensis]|uniref:F-box domain-containing protein n=1 Tax=Phyllosticta citrichinensis TaxID=1130410 RepID=A0ABR1Y1L7_9PEZI